MKQFLISDSELLEKLCLSLYDVLRPLIIHIIHLETLSELCSILKNEMLEDHVQNNGMLELFPFSFFWRLFDLHSHEEKLKNKFCQLIDISEMF